MFGDSLRVGIEWSCGTSGDESDRPDAEGRRRRDLLAEVSGKLPLSEADMAASRFVG